MSYELLKEKESLKISFEKLAYKYTQDYRKISSSFEFSLISISSLDELIESLKESKDKIDTFFCQFNTELLMINGRIKEIDNELLDISVDNEELRMRYYYLISIYYLDEVRYNKRFSRQYDYILKKIKIPSDELTSAESEIAELKEKIKQITIRMSKIDYKLRDENIKKLEDELQSFKDECKAKVLNGEITKRASRRKCQNKAKEINSIIESLLKESRIAKDIWPMKDKIEEIKKKIRFIKLGYTYQEAIEVVKNYLSNFPKDGSTSEPGKLVIHNFNNEGQIKLYGIKNQLLEMAQDHRLGQMLALLNALGNDFWCNVFMSQEYIDQNYKMSY